MRTQTILTHPSLLYVLSNSLPGTCGRGSAVFRRFRSIILLVHIMCCASWPTDLSHRPASGRTKTGVHSTL